MNPGYIRFSVTTLAIVAFYLGCDGSGKKDEAAQDASIQKEGDFGTGNVNENNPSEANQNTGDGGGNNPSDGNQSTGNESDGSRDSGNDSKGDSGTDQASEGDADEDAFSVGGTLSGLIAGALIVLHNNGADDLTVSVNGSFTFFMKLVDGAAYKVKIRTQPQGQYCEVTKGEGSIDGTDVTDVAVSCADPEEIDFGWAQVSVGGVHNTCAIRTDGRLFCWGNNQDNQPGNSYIEDNPVLVQEDTGASDWVQVSASNGHTCAINTDGRLFCWGVNQYGQLGNNSTRSSLVPVQEFTRASDWAQVSAGSRHTCAIKTDGRLFCWGVGGQLANNSLFDSPVPSQEGTAATDWTQVSADDFQSCAIKTDGRLFCWGGGSIGFVGPPTYRYVLLPTQDDAEASDWAQVSVSDKLWAMKSDGRLFWRSSDEWKEAQTDEQEGAASASWDQVYAGDDRVCAVRSDGQILCDYKGAFSNQPFPYLATDDWAQVSVRSDYACAVKVDGQLFCWGEQLGKNLTSTQSPVPVQEQSAAADWAQVSAGSKYACAVKSDGQLFCWGSNEDGQLGDNSTTDTNTLEPAQEHTAAFDWVQVSTGRLSHTCAVKSDGRLFCWGSNALGELGNNSTEDSLVPVQEDTRANNWAQVTVGDYYSCAVKSDGRLFCWGDNRNGQLGNNSTENSLVPVQEDTRASNWAQVSAGAGYTCAVKTDGRLFCWGDNWFGQLGDNSQSASLVPVQDDTKATDWAQVSASFEHTCAVKSDGRLFCWGNDQDYRTSAGGSVFVPLQEYSMATDWAQVSTASWHTCAVKTDGRLFCWGGNQYGALGNDSADCSNSGSRSCSFTPVQEATGAADWAEVSASTVYTCATKTDGRLFYWGEGTKAGTIDAFVPIRLTD